MSVFFNGRLITSPVTATVVDDTAMYNKNPDVGNVLAIVGQSGGGKPATAIRLRNAANAREVLRSGTALKAIEKAFDPSKQTGGPAEIVFVRVNPATQSTLTLKDSTATDCITLTSTDYGKYTTDIRVKVETGTLKGKKLTTQIGNAYYTIDNLERRAFSIRYTGAQSTATIAVTNDNVTILLGASSTTITLADYPTIRALVDRINAISPADLSAVLLDGNDDKAAVSGLDNISATDCKTADLIVTGTLQACVDWFNGAGEGFVTAVRPVAGIKVPVNIPFTYLAGGTDGTTTNSDWQSAFDALQKEDVQWVVPASPSATIHAMASAHVSYMSDVARLERRAIVGPDVSTSDSTAMTLAKAINSDRVSLTHLGIYDYDSAGNLTLYPPYVTAALLGGMITGVNPGTPLTNKTINVQGIERKLQNPTDTDQLIQAGVLAIEDTRKGYKVVKSISTWLVNNNYNRVEISTGTAVDYVSRAVREALDALRGSKASPILLADAVSRTETVLRELSRPEPMGIGVLVGDAKNPAYKNITASIEGDVVRVEFQCSPVLPVNYILCAIHVVPWSGSATI